MATWLIVFLCALAAVALFVLGMSLTLMIKGRNIDSEISTNKNMQRLGIRCAVQESREDTGQAGCADAGCAGNCSACDIEDPTPAAKAHPLTGTPTTEARFRTKPADTKKEE